MTAGLVCILLCAIFGISWVAGYPTAQEEYHDVPGYNQQPNNKQHFFQNVNQTIVFDKDGKVNSSVPLKEVESPDGHRKLAGTVHIPGGVSSVVVEESPSGRNISQSIEIGPIIQDGPVVINSNQDSSMPKKDGSNGSPDKSTQLILTMTIIFAIMNMLL